MTLFTLRQNREILKRTLLIYLGVTIFCVLFGVIYEQFSHGVFSGFMVFNFLFPLIGGFLVYFILFRIPHSKVPSIFTADVYNAGIATLTIASLFSGFLYIYGTTRDFYTYTFWIVGIVLTLSGIISYIISIYSDKKRLES